VPVEKLFVNQRSITRGDNGCWLIQQSREERFLGERIRTNGVDQESQRRGDEKNRQARQRGMASQMPLAALTGALAPGARLRQLSAGDPGQLRLMLALRPALGNQMIQRLAKSAQASAGGQHAISRQIERTPASQSFQGIEIHRQERPQAPPARGPTQERINQIVTDTIRSQLKAYNNISITVGEPMGAGEVGPPHQKTVTVHAVYYMAQRGDEPSERVARHRAPRWRAGAARISVALRRVTALLSPHAGRAVLAGKATPEEVKKFVEKALELNSIHRWAVRNRHLRQDQQLVDLPIETLRNVIQGWIDDLGVGVDCSGFVQIARIRARELVRAEARQAGVAEGALPREIPHRQWIPKGTPIGNPGDLRPGDVMRTPGHVRIVMSVRGETEVTPTPPSGQGPVGPPAPVRVIEFQTAESSSTGNVRGGRARGGAVSRTWQTVSLQLFHNPGQIMRPVGGGPGARNATFHRLP
jgi:cell wall-associated NlpC family hydrolase